MAKVTRLGWGAKGTNALEGIETSPGKNSSASSESKEKPLPKKQAVSPSPAQKTAPSLRTARKGSSSAGSAVGNPSKKDDK